MIPRLLEKQLVKSLKLYPVVTVIGPRQAGKTTLVKNSLSHFNYANLENPEIRSWASTDPKDFLMAKKPPVIFDEIQRAPELLSWIQVNSDESGRKGQYVLTGSNQPALSEAISQSLAGRTSILKLLPLSWEELVNAGYSFDRDEALVKGFLPRVWNDDLPPMHAYMDYFSTYVERDLRQMLKIKDLFRFEVFLRLLAGRVGQVVNLHSLSGEVGVSSTTLADWLSVLEASFIVFRLHPYHDNLGKRLVKSPKIFFTEPGLAAALLQIEEPAQASRDPLMGNLFENIVVVELLKGQLNRGINGQWSYFRDNSGHEIDLIWEQKRIPTPIEIKAGRTWSNDWKRTLKWFAGIAPACGSGWVIHPGEEPREGTSHPSTCARDILGEA